MTKDHPQIVMTVKAVTSRPRAGSHDTLMSSGFSDDSRHGSVRKDSVSQKEKSTRNTQKRLSVLPSDSDEDENDIDNNSSKTVGKGKSSAKNRHQDQNEPESEFEVERQRRNNANKGKTAIASTNSAWTKKSNESHRQSKDQNQGQDQKLQTKSDVDSEDFDSEEEKEYDRDQKRVTSKNNNSSKSVSHPASVSALVKRTPVRTLCLPSSSSSEYLSEEEPKTKSPGNKKGQVSTSSKFTSNNVPKKISKSEKSSVGARSSKVVDSGSDSVPDFDDEQSLKSDSSKIRSSGTSSGQGENNNNGNTARNNNAGSGSSFNANSKGKVSSPPRNVTRGTNRDLMKRNTSVESNYSQKELARKQQYAHIEVSPNASLFNFNFKSTTAGRGRGVSSGQNKSIETDNMSPTKKLRSRSLSTTTSEQTKGNLPETRSKAAEAGGVSKKASTKTSIPNNAAELTSTTATGEGRPSSSVAFASKSTSKGSVNLFGLIADRIKEKQKQTAVKEPFDATYELSEGVKGKTVASNSIQPRSSSSSTMNSKDTVAMGTRSRTRSGASSVSVPASDATYVQETTKPHVIFNRRTSTAGIGTGTSGCKKRFGSLSEAQDQSQGQSQGSFQSHSHSNTSKLFTSTKRIASNLNRLTPDASYDDQTRRVETRTSRNSSAITSRQKDNKLVTNTNTEFEVVDLESESEIESESETDPEVERNKSGAGLSKRAPNSQNASANTKGKSNQNNKGAGAKVLPKRKPKSGETKSTKAYKVKVVQNSTISTRKSKDAVPVPVQVSSRNSPPQDFAYALISSSEDEDPLNNVGRNDTVPTEIASGAGGSGSRSSIHQTVNDNSSLPNSVPDNINNKNANANIVRVYKSVNELMNVKLAPLPAGVKLACLLDTNGNAYRQLKNSHQNPRVTVDLSAPCVSILHPENLIWTQIHPGILMCLTFQSGIMKTGYMRIAGKAVKPLEKSGESSVIISVLDGEIKLKSTNFSFNEAKDPFLNPVVLYVGSFITVPSGTMYSIENWEDEEASLQITIISHPQPNYAPEGEGN